MFEKIKNVGGGVLLLIWIIVMRKNEEKIDDFLLDWMLESDWLVFEKEVEKDFELVNEIKV